MPLAAEEFRLGLLHVAKKVREMHDPRHVGVDELDAAARMKRGLSSGTMGVNPIRFDHHLPGKAGP